ncbi:hypothetical protein HPB49_009525 [Dermacentor silvarum]|uniref:Uncharacterized protein n=1 Tax=Dermacentor silvarum TaxID=543639 RepID=A0ACB8DCD9_DERSI|nr:hypothetical protein HPB49_009525 [Dermacentor silvarum]
MTDLGLTVRDIANGTGVAWQRYADDRDPTAEKSDPGLSSWFRFESLLPRGPISSPWPAVARPADRIGLPEETTKREEVEGRALRERLDRSSQPLSSPLQKPESAPLLLDYLPDHMSVHPYEGAYVIEYPGAPVVVATEPEGTGRPYRQYINRRSREADRWSIEEGIQASPSSNVVAMPLINWDKATATDLACFTAERIREELSRRYIDSTGSKDDIIQRLPIDIATKRTRSSPASPTPEQALTLSQTANRTVNVTTLPDLSSTLPTFSGDGGLAAHRWVKDLEPIQQLASWEPATLLAIALGKLRGPAAHWRVTTGSNFTTWPEWKKAFLNQFGQQLSLIQWQECVAALTQARGETLANYALAKLKILTRCPVQLTCKERIEYLNGNHDCRCGHFSPNGGAMPPKISSRTKDPDVTGSCPDTTWTMTYLMTYDLSSSKRTWTLVGVEWDKADDNGPSFLIKARILLAALVMLITVALMIIALKGQNLFPGWTKTTTEPQLNLYGD